MTYVMSDIHGFYNKYLDFLKSVNFSGEDTLYIVGDLIDRGCGGIALVQDVMCRKNIKCLKGNHELMNAEVLNELCMPHSTREYEKIIREELSLSDIGQEDTLTAFSKLGSKDKRKIAEFFGNAAAVLCYNRQLADVSSGARRPA